MKRPRILFVDDQESARKLYLRILDPGEYEALVAASVPEAEEILRDREPSVVITDLRMPGVDGLEGLARFHAIDPDLPVILVTAFGTVETAVEAMKQGAFDYIRKPFEPGEIEIVVDRALAHRDLLAENARLRSEVARHAGSTRIIGRSPGMAAALGLVARVAPTDHSVLITGESGTGKDLIAREIHRLSARKDGPLVSINCSAIPEHLLESELFGYEKGAFSGATAARPGFFGEADGGTLFLDEIGDMSMALQPKLLRVLQDGDYYPVGGRQVMRTDVRVVCASNQNMQEQVERGSFRQDLYYRINTVEIALPPLRERSEDIPLLVEHFLARVRESAPVAPEGVDTSAMRALLEYRWPGNVRELQHAVDRASLVCDSRHIGLGDLPPEIRGQGSAGDGDPAGLGYREARARFDRAYFTTLLDKVEGNVQQAAELAGLHRSTLYEKLAKLGLTPE